MLYIGQRKILVFCSVIYSTKQTHRLVCKHQETTSCRFSDLRCLDRLDQSHSIEFVSPLNGMNELSGKKKVIVSADENTAPTLFSCRLITERFIRGGSTVQSDPTTRQTLLFKFELSPRMRMSKIKGSRRRSGGMQVFLYLLSHSCPGQI